MEKQEPSFTQPLVKSESVEGLEMEELNRQFWENPDYKTISVTRHADLVREPGKSNYYSLSPKGIAETRILAGEMKRRVPFGANASIFESSSFIPFYRADGKIISPIRASQTASIFEKEIFGSLAASDPNNPTESSRRIRDLALTDMYEKTNKSQPGVAEHFWSTLINEYKGDGVAAFSDYMNWTIRPRSKEEFKKIGGLPPAQLAKNFLEFIKERTAVSTDEADKNLQKSIDFGISHQETITAFIKYVELLSARKQKDPNAPVVQPVDYNEGFDIHACPGENKFQFFLQKRKIKKEGDKIVGSYNNPYMCEVSFDELEDFINNQLEQELGSY